MNNNNHQPKQNTGTAIERMVTSKSLSKLDQKELNAITAGYCNGEPVYEILNGMKVLVVNVWCPPEKETF